MFYITAQDEESQEAPSAAEGRWVLPLGAVTVLLKCLKDDTDEAVRHYAAKVSVSPCNVPLGLALTCHPLTCLIMPCCAMPCLVGHHTMLCDERPGPLQMFHGNSAPILLSSDLLLLAPPSHLLPSSLPYVLDLRECSCSRGTRISKAHGVKRSCLQTTLHRSI